MLPCRTMSKGSEGKAGRLGDDTRARINDLKGGWKLPNADGERAAQPEAEPRASVEVAESVVGPLDSSAVDPMEELPTIEAPRRKTPLPSLPTPKPPPRASKPPQPPGPRVAKNSQPPPFRPRAASGPANPIKRTKAVSVPPPAPPLKKRETTPALPPAAVVAAEGADDDAPTRVASLDEPVVPAPASGPSGIATGTVRLPDSLPRETGLLGDIGYFMRVLAKRRASATEMLAIGVRIASEKEARNTKLLDYARQAVGDDAFDQTLVGRARSSLLNIEEKRSLHAGRIASANEKESALDRQRKEVKDTRDMQISELETEVKAIAASLEPLVARASDARKRTTQLRLQLRGLDDQVLKKEASLVSVQGSADKASVHAEIASLRAERASVAGDEPAIAAEVDDLEPKIASLASSKTEIGEKIAALRADEELDIVRAAEKTQAVKASRVVEERAVSDQAVKQEKELLELGEGLHHNPPDSRAPEAVAIMRHDVEIGTLERRSLEITELLGSVERGPMVRGGTYLAIAMLVPVLVAVSLVVLR